MYIEPRTLLYENTNVCLLVTEEDTSCEVRDFFVNFLTQNNIYYQAQSLP